MLVLSRKTEQTIRIGDDITITIVRVKGNSVRVGVQAPDNMRILRGELESFEKTPGVNRVANLTPNVYDFVSCR